MNIKIWILAPALIASAHAADTGISDEQWSQIAGEKTKDTYEIQKGDTLWDLSQKLFGNPHYWPKVWSLNNASGVTNPHVLPPGKTLVFTPGTAGSVPTVTTSTPAAPVAAAETTAAPEEPAEAPESNKQHEYDKVNQDLWKPINVADMIPKNDYDEYGLEKEIRVQPASRLSMRIPAIANESTIPYLGEISGSRREGVGLTQNEIIFIKSEASDLQVGTVYSVMSEPIFINEKKSDRSGYVYRAIAEVKIIGIKDGSYLGVITKAYDVVKRGDRLYPLLPNINDLKPVPAQESIEGVVLLNPAEATWSSAQYNFIHIDRGLEDGVQTGNIFRVYDYYDPVTREKLTESDIMPSADAIIVHVTAQFSTALVITSKNVIRKSDFGVLLTDVSSIEKKAKDLSRDFAPEKKSGTPSDDPELDELDALDNANDSGMGRKEEQEIKELENWDRTKDIKPEEPAPPSSQPDAVTNEPKLETPAPAPAPETTNPLPSVPEAGAPGTGTTAPAVPQADPVIEPLSESATGDAALDAGTPAPEPAPAAPATGDPEMPALPAEN